MEGSQEPSGNFQSKIDKPKTAITKRVKQMNRDKILIFIQEKCEGLLEGTNVIKEDNKVLFGSWNTWCSESKIHIEYNKIAFGMKVGNIGKKIEKAINKVGISKNTNSETLIYPEVIKEYMEYLDNM